jgi:hypothetical protein
LRWESELPLTPIDNGSTDFPRYQHPVKELGNSDRIRPIAILPRSRVDNIATLKVMTADELMEQSVLPECTRQLHLTDYV